MLNRMLSTALLTGLIAAALTASAATAPAVSVIWSWSAPTAYSDGTAIPATVAITYNAYIGTAGPGSEPATATKTAITGTTLTTSGYAAGQTVCGEFTAVAKGVESIRSAQACRTFPAVPNPPTNLAAQ